MKYLGLKFSPKDLGAKVFFFGIVMWQGREICEVFRSLEAFH